MRSSPLATFMVALFIAAAGCGDGGNTAGAWEFKVDSARGTSWLRVVGEEGASGSARGRGVMLSFDCLPDNAGARIMTEQSLRQGSVEARLSVDSSPTITLSGFAGTTPTGGQVVFTAPQDSLLAMLSGRRLAVLEYTDGAGSSRTTARFPLPGLETYLDAYQASCRKNASR